MRALVARVLNDQSPEVRTKVLSMYAILISANVLLWALTLAVSTQFAVVLGIGLSAYTLGPAPRRGRRPHRGHRNVTRKLMQEGKRPVAVGFFFSLGHSSVVVLLSVLVAVAAAFVQSNLPRWQDIGGLIGTFVSALFLYVIGIINLLVLIDIYRMFRRVTRGGTYSEETWKRSWPNAG